MTVDVGRGVELLVACKGFLWETHMDTNLTINVTKYYYFYNFYLLSLIMTSGGS